MAADEAGPKWSNHTCRDCGADTEALGEFYMLRDEVWGETGMGPDEGMLCVGCVEGRLGRRLGPADFTHVVVNLVWPENMRALKSSRLLDRLAA